MSAEHGTLTAQAPMTPLYTVNPADLPSLPLDERKALPDTPAIYFVLAADTVLYIGQSVNVRQRWLAHHRFAQLNEYGGCRIAWMTVDDASLLDDLERACIAHFSPILNREPLPDGGRALQLTIRMTRDMYTHLEEASKADKRRVGEMARLIIEEFLPVVQARLARRQHDEQ